MSGIKFGRFLVEDQVFFKTAYSFALVNLKPILPGHVLVCPLRQVQRLKDLTTDETVDFFLAVQKVQAKIESIYNAKSMTIAIQDGPFAGQTVPHLHCHIIPRKPDDFEGRVDEIYEKMDSGEYDVEAGFYELKRIVAETGKYKKIEDDERAPRSMETMVEEAKRLSEVFKNEN